MNELHIYSQYAHHCEAIIVGDREALIALRDALNQALTQGAGTSAAFTNDGEGYFACVRIASAGEMQTLTMPYTADYCQNNGNGKWPELAGCAELIRAQQQALEMKQNA